MKRGNDGNQGQAAKRMTGGQRPGGGVQQAKLTTSDALSYLREVKTRFADKKDVYDTFLEIMKEFKAQRIDTAGVIQRVKKLFKGHRELILGFNTFLPKGYEIELARVSDDEEEPKNAPGKGQFIQKQPVEFDQAINYVNKIKNRFSNDDRVYKQFLEILNMYRKGQKTIHTVYNEVSVLFRSHADLLDEFTYFLPDAQAVKDSQRKQQPSTYRAGAPGGKFQEVFRRTVSPHLNLPQHKRKVVKPKVEEKVPVAHYEDDRKSILPRELQFFERVRVRIRSREAYNDLIRCIHMFNVELFSRNELITSVTDILGKFPDLLLGFHEFLTSCETLELPVPGANNAALMKQRALLVSKDKMLSKPLSEIVSHETERITPSYVKIPASYPKLACSGRTGLDLSVLNDTFVNVITGSEDFSFKLMRKNQYEEALFRCEDDRYEFEMCLEVNASAIRVMKPLAERIQAMSSEDRHIFRVEDCSFTPVHYKAVDTLYGDQGSMMVELLKRSPAFAVPVILPRLEAKDVEWRKIKEEMSKVWKKIYQENYHKSLDHRSFYFKQSEKKLLLPKTMVQEIRDSADRRKQTDLSNRLSASELTHRYHMAPPGVKPDLTFDYLDPLVFDDCWSILRTAIDEAQMSHVHREHVLELYITSVEAFFCLPTRSEELAKIKAKTKGVLAAKRDGEGSHEEDEGAVRKRLVKDDEDGQENSAADMDIDGKDGEGQEAASNGDGDGGEESNDEGLNPLGSYASSKPLSPYMGPGKENGPAFSDLPSHARVLLANEMMYLFFRYHRHLYDRLYVARKCAMQQAAQATLLKSRGQGGLASLEGVDGGGVGSGAGEGSASEEDSDRIHASFMDMSQQLLKGDLEISLYEDQVRTLLGTNSFELFTLDKLLHRLINHMRMMTQDDNTMRLWGLFKYEQSRTGGVNSFAYHVNSHPILDDSCYRIEFNRNNDKVWTAVLVDPVDKAEINQGASAMEGPLTECIRAYIAPSAKPWLAPRPTMAPGHPPLGEDETLDKGGPWRPFLLKNLASAWLVPKSSCTPEVIGAMEAEKVLESLEQVVLHNGLECKVSCVHSKVSYVLDTEDLMYHRVRKAGSDIDSYKMTRSSRFLQWYDSTMAKIKADALAAEALIAATTNGDAAAPVPMETKTAELGA